MRIAAELRSEKVFMFMPRHRAAFLYSAFVLLALSAGGQAQNATEVRRAAPAFDAIVPFTARIEKLAGGFGFVEGPIWIHEGYLLFSDIPNNVILKWTPGAGLSVFLTHSGFAGETPHAGEFIGSNGLTLDHDGRLIMCEHGNRRVERLGRNGTRTLIADRYQGKRLNSPNDVVVKSDGAIYFTDPPFGLARGNHDPTKELPFNGVYRVSGGKVMLLTQELSGPNGLVFSPDEKYLYVDDSDKRLIFRYRVQADGTLADSKLFFDMSKHPEGVPDGMKVDMQGNLYCAGAGGIWIISPDGQYLGLIAPPEVPANLNWGDGDARMLYMTARSGLYRVHLNIAGIRP
jgi:gluconolactonase